MTLSELNIEVYADEAIDDMRKLRDEDIPEFANEWVDKMALTARRLLVMQSTYDHGHPTGRLRGSIDIYDLPDGVEIGPTVEYATWVWDERPGTKWIPTKTHEKAAKDLMDRAPVITELLLDKYIMKGGS